MANIGLFLMIVTKTLLLADSLVGAADLGKLNNIIFFCLLIVNKWQIYFDALICTFRGLL